MSNGFTLIELLIVMGIFAIVSAFTTINLIKPQSQASIDAATSVLIADLKQQQLKAMAGSSSNQSEPQPFGIFFEPNKYILFFGSTYIPNPDNFEINLEQNLTFSNINLPSSSIIFKRIDGEVVGFSAGTNSITLQNTSTGEIKTIQFNRLGSTTVN